MIQVSQAIDAAGESTTAKAKANAGSLHRRPKVHASKVWSGGQDQKYPLELKNFRITQSFRRSSEKIEAMRGVP